MKQTITWWEKKRIWFNLIVGATGIIALLIIQPKLLFEDFAGIFSWGILANILYSFGVTLESWNQFYLNQKLNLYKQRHLFFILGTSIYCLSTWTVTFYHYEGYLTF